MNDFTCIISIQWGEWVMFCAKRIKKVWNYHLPKLRWGLAWKITLWYILLLLLTVLMLSALMFWANSQALYKEKQQVLENAASRVLSSFAQDFPRMQWKRYLTDSIGLMKHARVRFRDMAWDSVLPRGLWTLTGGEFGQKIWNRMGHVSAWNFKKIY